MEGASADAFCEECNIIVTPERCCEHFNVIEDNSALTVEVDEPEACTFEELLISRVQEKRILWDTKTPLKERPKNQKDDAWQEISEAFGNQYDVEILQKRWKNLRDTYLKAKAEMECYVPSGSEGKKRKKPWKFYEMMTFMSQIITPRSTVSNLRGVRDSIGSSPLGEPSPEPSTSRQKDQTKGPASIEAAIIDAIQAVPAPPMRNEPRKVNHICLQLSEILEKLPSRKRAELEIEFLTKAYTALHEEEDKNK